MFSSGAVTGGYDLLLVYTKVVPERGWRMCAGRGEEGGTGESVHVCVCVCACLPMCVCVVCVVCMCVYVLCVCVL